MSVIESTIAPFTRCYFLKVGEHLRPEELDRLVVVERIELDMERWSNPQSKYCSILLMISFSSVAITKTSASCLSVTLLSLLSHLPGVGDVRHEYLVQERRGPLPHRHYRSAIVLVVAYVDLDHLGYVIAGLFASSAPWRGGSGRWSPWRSPLSSKR